MKLQELANTSQVKQVTQILESYFNKNFEFDRLTRPQAAKMLSRVQRMIKEQRSSSGLHTSEQNPAYLKLIMMEQALKAKVQEVNTSIEVKKNPSIPGQQVTTGPAKSIMKGASVQQAAQTRQMQQGRTGTTTMPPGQKAGTIIKGQITGQQQVQELKRHRGLREASELQQAQVVLASQDMIDQLQGMIEDVSEMQFKDLPALIDQAKSEVGPGNATQFQQAATQALAALLQAVQQGKSAMEGAQAALTGQAPVPIAGTEAGAAPAGEMSTGEEMPGGEMPGEEMPAPVEAEPEAAPSGRTLGRGRR